MKVLLDTNIIIDNLARRDEYGESFQILNLCESGLIKGTVTTATAMDTMYVMRKYLSLAEASHAMQILLQIVDIIPVIKNDISAAFKGGFRDYEDAVQASCAQRIKADYIATRNVKDFEKSSVPAVSPDVILRMLNA